MREFFTIAIFKIKADIRMNKTTLNSQKEKHSTLSLRRATFQLHLFAFGRSFLSTLSLRRATDGYGRTARLRGHFYPRSPCGERRGTKPYTKSRYQFLSTLSLRRATEQEPGSAYLADISIHALLAESDQPPQYTSPESK